MKMFQRICKDHLDIFLAKIVFADEQDTEDKISCDSLPGLISSDEVSTILLLCFVPKQEVL